MKCYIYRSKKKPDNYVYLNKKDNFDVLPEELKKVTGETELSFEFTLSEDKPLAREDSKKVMANLQKQGYHLQVPPPINNYLDEFKLTNKKQ